MIHKNKDKIIIGLKKAQSLIGKIQEMVEQNQYCVDVMQQNLAAVGLLKSVHKQLMEDHINSCFADGMKSNNQKQKNQLIEEMIQVSNLYNR
ncbi:MAG: hypothetical protein UU76_C0007G0004 [Parcubacteria group bacterium GW2011_GWC1_41_7]|nr:MAG: hypothetical protein UU76_C0007G0004 [Parcubacteria group bacterium GW2011_GWC1_41_7]